MTRPAPSVSMLDTRSVSIHYDSMVLHYYIVPTGESLAKVIPLYKGKCKESITKYRPISLLSNIAKILEKVVHKRLLSFLTRCDILYNSQYGFRPNCSTIYN